jgi:hypothetical protein
VFQYLGVVPLFRRLAETARVGYYSVYSDRPSRKILAEWEGKEEGASPHVLRCAVSPRGKLC